MTTGQDKRSLPADHDERMARARLSLDFTVWCAAWHLHNYEEAFWTTVSGLGDRDTTCAIVGSIVAMAVGREGIPADWLKSRERLP